MGVSNGASGGQHVDAEQQELFLAVINDLCGSLHTQAATMRSCLALGSGLPETFQATADEVIFQLTNVISRSREDLCYAAAGAGLLRDPSQTDSSTRDSSRLFPPRPSAPVTQMSSACCADHQGWGGSSGSRDKQELILPDSSLACDKPVGMPAITQPMDEADAIFEMERQVSPVAEIANVDPPVQVANGGPTAHSSVLDTQGQPHEWVSERDVITKESDQNGVGKMVAEGAFQKTLSIEKDGVMEAGVMQARFPEKKVVVEESPEAKADIVDIELTWAAAPTNASNASGGSEEKSSEKTHDSEKEHDIAHRRSTTSVTSIKDSVIRRLSVNSKGAKRPSILEGQENSESITPRLSAGQNSQRGSAVTSQRGSAVSSTSSFNRASMVKRMSFCEQLEMGEDADFEGLPQGKCVDGVMNPNWPGRLGWDMGVILLVAVDAMVLPFQMAYKDGQVPDDFDVFWLWMTTSFFATDMIASFFTAYSAGKAEPEMAPGKLVTSKFRIARQYLKTWFVIDFASTIPWGKFADMLTGGGQSSAESAQMMKLTKVVKFVRFLRLMRMLRLAKLAVIWERVEASMGNLALKQSVALIRVIFVLIGICHWNACIWWIVGQKSSLFTELLSEDAKKAYEAKPHWTTTLRRTGEDEWRWVERDRTSQYIFCFYWTLGVMRTMPAEVQPENTTERLYIMVFMFFAFSAFAICVALITQTFFKFSERKRMFDEDMAAVRMYMRQIKVEDNVQNSVKLFLKHLFDRRKIQAREIPMLSLLPNSVCSLLKNARLTPYLLKLGIFDALPTKAIYYVSELAEIKDLSPGSCLCRRGRRAEAAYVLMSGRLSVQGLDRGFHVQNLEAVDAECLLSSQQIVVSVRTVISCACSEVVRVDRVQFFKMLRQNEDFKRSWSFKVFDIDEGCTTEPMYQNPTQKPDVTGQSQAAIATTAAIVAS